MIGKLFQKISELSKHFLAKDEGARILQLGGILRFGLIFIQGVVLVKVGIPLAMIGQIGLVFFFANFLMFYLQNGGRNAMLTWVPADNDTSGLKLRLGTVFIVMQFFGLIGALIILLISQLSPQEKYLFLYEGNNLIYLAVYIFFTIPVVPLIYNYLLTNRHRRILWFITISYTLQITAVLVPIVMGFGLSSMIMALAAFSVLRWGFALIDGRWFADGLPSRALLMAFFVFVLPLVVHAFNGGLMDYIDGWIVSWYYGEEQFAIYTFGAKEFPVNALLIGGLLTGLIPRFKKEGAVDHQILKSEIKRLIRTLLPINCALILTSPLLYTLVYSADFTLSARIFNIYALTLLSRVVVNQVYLYVMHRNWTLAISTMVEVILNIILSVILMRSMGLIGIPLATVIAYAAHKIFIVYFVKINLKTAVHQYFPVRQYALALLAMGACFIIAEMIYF
jgi:O-antigen/teichoic acid export membrane protein